MGSKTVEVRVWGRALLLLTGCWAVLPVSASAQGGVNGAKVHRQEMDRRELQLSNLGRDGRRPNDPKRSRAMMDQVGEDFHRILTLHNEIVRAIDAKRPLGYQFISDATGEIRKRSTRLQASLMLQKPEPPPGNPRPDLTVLETKDQLILLCRQIESFVRNPIIETPGTVDAKLLEKARSDLESIAELSGAIKKHADKQKN